MPNRATRILQSLALIIAVTLIASWAIAAYELELPEAPEGFEWKKIKKIKAAFLVPTGWHFKAEKYDDTLAYFITKENIDDVGRFDTGLSINVFRKLKDRDAVEYARKFVESMAEQNALVHDWTIDMGAFKGFGCLTRNAVEGEDVFIMMHTLAIANDSTNTFYLLFFESLEAEWDEAWTIGDQILKLFLVDDEI